MLWTDREPKTVECYYARTITGTRSVLFISMLTKIWTTYNKMFNNIAGNKLTTALHLSQRSKNIGFKDLLVH